MYSIHFWKGMMDNFLSAGPFDRLLSSDKTYSEKHLVNPMFEFLKQGPAVRKLGCTNPLDGDFCDRSEISRYSV